VRDGDVTLGAREALPAAACLVHRLGQPRRLIVHRNLLAVYPHAVAHELVRRRDGGVHVAPAVRPPSLAVLNVDA